MSWSGGDFDDFPALGPRSSHIQTKSSRGGRRAQPISVQQQYGNQQRQTAADKLTIEELNSMPGSSCSKLVGVIIGKEDPRHFPSKKDPTSERHVLSFTLRDSPNDFINVTCWGSGDYITELANRFTIGEVVELHDANVCSVPHDGSHEKFRPSTPSACYLNLSENSGSLRLCTDDNFEDYTRLSHIPVKAPNDYYTISDIMSNGQSVHGESLNILAVVRSVGAPVEVNTKTGKKMTRCEVKLFDDTAPNLTLILWDKSLIQLTESWIPKDHVVFVCDVRVTFNDFKKTMVATANSKTIITVNPDTREAHQLYKYAQTVDLDEMNALVSNQDGGNHVDIATIQEVRTVEQIKARQSSATDNGGTFCVICYGVITHFDLDGNPFSVVSVRCSKCRYRVDRHAGVCTNPNCPQGSLLDLDAESTETETVYDLRVSVADHTGALEMCRMAPDTAQAMLGATPSEFLQLSDERKTELKWNFLMEKCKVYFKINLPTFERPDCVPRIISCERADPTDAIQYLQ